MDFSLHLDAIYSENRFNFVATTNLTPMTEDYILILQLIGGSKQAFSALYQKYVDRVYGYVLSMTHNQTTAEDITQYCFMKVWEHHARLRPEDNFAAYLYVVARNATYNETRRRLSATRYADFVARSAEGAINYTLCDVNVSMLRQEMQKVVATLPEVRRKIYLLSSEQNMTNAEIAQALGISVKTVETQLGRVTAAMRRKLAPYL